jgi:Predicted membrane protein (DUF2142)
MIMPRTLAALYLFYATAVVVLMNLILPPMAAPDEFAHLFRAETISTGQFLLAPGPDRFIGGTVDSSLFELRRIFGSQVRDVAPTPAEVAIAARRLAWTGTPMFSRLSVTGQYGPVFYLPQASGLVIGRALGLSVIQSYGLARLFSALTAVGVAAIAIANAGRGGFVLATVLSTPMFLFLATSLSQDGQLVAVSALFAVLAARVQPPGSGVRNAMAWLCAVLMAMGRWPYALLSVVLVRPRGDRSAGRWLRETDGPLAPVVVCAIVVLWLVAVGAANQPSLAPDPTIDPWAQMAGLLNDPWSILRIAAGTIANDEFLRVSREVIGVLGYLTITLSPWAYRAAGDAIVLAAATCLLQGPGRSPLHSVAAAIVFMLSIGAIYASLYLVWTPVGATYVLGVQGRYLLPYLVGLPLIVPSIIPAKWRSNKAWDKALDRAAATAGFVAWGLMVAAGVDALVILHTAYGGVLGSPWRAPIGQ